MEDSAQLRIESIKSIVVNNGSAGAGLYRLD
jgi:hypothetical protein